MEEIFINLYVNTQSIDSKTVDANCNFEQPKGTANEDYTVDVNVDDTIVWNGISLDSDKDLVVITQIVYTGGYNIFGKQSLKGDDNNEVTAIVENKTEGKNETYTLFFDVFNSKKYRGSYQIDPKLKVNL